MPQPNISGSSAAVAGWQPINTLREIWTKYDNYFNCCFEYFMLISTVKQSLYLWAIKTKQFMRLQGINLPQRLIPQCTAPSRSQRLCTRLGQINQATRLCHKSTCCRCAQGLSTCLDNQPARQAEIPWSLSSRECSQVKLFVKCSSYGSTKIHKPVMAIL